MAVSTIVTTAGSASANAYCDVAFADQYNADRPPDADGTWAAATPDQKAQAILWATRLLDSLWQWTGYPTDDVQALQWPRGAMLKPSGWSYVDIHTIPVELQRATAEFARQLLVADRAGDSDVETQGITSLKAGPVSLTFKDSVTAKVIPDAVFDLIPPEWGWPRSRGMGYRQLLRS